MGKQAIMNSELGTKWFTFYTKVKPCITCISALGTLLSFSENTSIYISNFPLLLGFLATLGLAILSVLVAIKSEGNYEEFVAFVEGVLIIEIINASYQLGIQQYYQNGYDLASTVIVSSVMLLLSYFLWYRPNKKYFRKRLMFVPNTIDIQSSPKIEHICLSTDDEPLCPQSSHDVYGADFVLKKDNTQQAQVILEKTVPTTTPISIPQAQSQKPFSVKQKTIKTHSNRYCSRCGNPIDPISKKCSGCGKQYFRGIPWKTVVICLFVLLFIVSLATNYHQYTQNNKLNDIVNELNTNISMLKDTIEELEGNILDLENENYSQSITIRDYSNEINLIYNELVFVRKGELQYHRHDCIFIDDHALLRLDTEYSAYNIGAAKTLGYHPCALCIGLYSSY